MKYSFLFIACCLFGRISAQKGHDYKVVNTYRIASAGGWDYIVVHDGKLYVSHGNQVNILNEANGDSVGIIANTEGVHGIAFNDALARGYTSNGRTNNVTVFDANTNAVITHIDTGENPDAIMYEPFTKTIITCNGRSKNLSVIDPASNTVIKTIAVGGKPETAVSDGKGMLFVNIEDKNEIVVVDLNTKTVMYHWPLSGAEGPTGLVYDDVTQRLFAGCEKQLAVLNATNGKVITKLPIGEGCDGVAFDSRANIIFTSNGADGTMTAVKVESANTFSVIGNFATKRGGRTIAIDETTGTLFIPTADFESGEKVNGRPKMMPGTFSVLVIK
ncbi:MAG TPA: YncE family protein [Flavitalea sp.]|nr:YncE family protein [Flavitalea sp.]